MGVKHKVFVKEHPFVTACCDLCGKKEVVHPMSVACCQECYKQIIANHGYKPIMYREMLGGWCDIHKAMKFNVTAINVRVCLDCINKMKGIGKQYKKERGAWERKFAEKVYVPKDEWKDLKFKPVR